MNVSVLRESSFRGAGKYGMLSNDADNERDGIRRDSGALPRGACLGLVGLACIAIRNIRSISEVFYVEPKVAKYMMKET